MTPIGPASPAGWEPAAIIERQSSRRDGMIPSIVDAWQDVREARDGQPLTPTQISVLTPHLARAYGMSPGAVAHALDNVRLYVGGPAANLPWTAVTIGRDIYLRGREELQAIEGWDQRRWPAHECGHVMQHERIPTPQTPTRIERMHRSMRNYAVRMALDSHWGPGAVPRGLVWWAHENLNPRNHAKTHIRPSDAIHDSHDLELEAERHAETFAGATLGPTASGQFDRGR